MRKIAIRSVITIVLISCLSISLWMFNQALRPIVSFEATESQEDVVQLFESKESYYNYSTISALFKQKTQPSVQTLAPLESNVQTVPTMPPKNDAIRYRYLGAVVDENGQPWVFVKNETAGILLKIGKAAQNGIELLENTPKELILQIDGEKIYVQK